MLNAQTKQETLKRLRRIAGQIAGIERMVNDERYCIEIIHQVTAARRALDQVALGIMRRHVDSCVSEAIRSKQGAAKIEELMTTVHQFIT